MALGPDHTPARNQFALFRYRRFAPFFWTQFFGAFNDNIFKNALMIFITFQVAAATAHPALWLNLAAGVFILPFFLFSGLAGQLADKYERSMLIRRIKAAEIGIMILVPVAFAVRSLPMLLALLFFMGAQSTLFGPVKYSLLPQHLHDKELMGGNGMVEMGTYAAILIGTVGGGLLIQMPQGGLWTGLGVTIVAIAGFMASRRIPIAPAPSPALRINWHLPSQTVTMVAATHANKPVFRSILAISWFWFVGACYLTQLPAYVRTVLGGNEQMVTVLLVAFSLGIGLGSLACERLSGRQVELGLVPIGGLGMALAGADLYWAGPAAAGTAGTIGALVGTGAGWRLLADFAAIGAFGGLFSVPLYAFIQARTPVDHRARCLAANNILNALFMVAAAAVGALLPGMAGMDLGIFFLLLAVATLVVTGIICAIIPDAVTRFLIWILTRTCYRVQSADLDQIPEQGPAVLISNHVSFIDGLLIASATRRPVRFVVWAPIYRAPLLHWFFRMVGAIPIDSARRDRRLMMTAFDQISRYLAAGELVCIFPEGMITRDGRLNAFKKGIEEIIRRNPVPVIPMAIQGLWGSRFSRCARLTTIRGRSFFRRIAIIAGRPVPPAQVRCTTLHDCVQQLMDTAMNASGHCEHTPVHL